MPSCHNPGAPFSSATYQPFRSCVAPPHDAANAAHESAATATADRKLRWIWRMFVFIDRYSTKPHPARIVAKWLVWVATSNRPLPLRLRMAREGIGVAATVRGGSLSRAAAVGYISRKESPPTEYFLSRISGCFLKNASTLAPSKSASYRLWSTFTS